MSSILRPTLLMFSLFFLTGCGSGDTPTLPENNGDSGETSTLPTDGCTPNAPIPGWTMTDIDLSSANLNPRALSFVNRETGFIAGYNGRILKTTDRGDSWANLNSGSHLHLFTISFVNESIGYVGGDARYGSADAESDRGAVLLKTTDGGSSWGRRYFPELIGFRSLTFFSDSEGVGLVRISPGSGFSGVYKMARTTDRGETWTVADIPVHRTFDQCLVQGDNVVAVSEGTALFVSDDRGKTWRTVDTDIPPQRGVYGIHMVNDRIGFLEAHPGIYRTADGGETWNSIDVPFDPIDMMYFYDSQHGFVVNSLTEYKSGVLAPIFKGSYVYQTADGGMTWSECFVEGGSVIAGITDFPTSTLGFSLAGSTLHRFER